MKKVFLILFIMMIIVASAISITPSFATTSPHKGLDYSVKLAWHQEHLWSLGKNLSVGDSYTYKICDPDAILNYSAESYHYFTKDLEHNGSLCYTIQMDFVTMTTTDENQISGDVWIVQAVISDEFSDNIRNSVFHVDAESFEVRSADTIHPDTIRYADSLQDTVFSIHKYTAAHAKLLMPGASWGEVTEYHNRGENPHMTVLDQIKWDANSYHFGILKQKTVTEQKQLDVFSVGYDVEIIDAFDVRTSQDDKEEEEENGNNVTNSFLVSSHLPFPVSGTYYNPSYVIEPHKEYEFEMVRYLETKSNRPLQEPINDNDDDMPIDVDPDLPVTITGTIELTFPDDPIPNNDDDVVVANNDDDVVVANNDDDVVVANNDDDVVVANNDDVTTNNSESTQNDSTMPVIVILAIVLGVAVFLIWKRPSFQWNKKKKNQNITRKRIAFEEKIKLEIETEP